MPHPRKAERNYILYIAVARCLGDQKKKENKKKPTKKSEEKLHALKQGLVLTLLISFFFWPTVATRK